MLTLSNNRLNGSIPQEIGFLTSLSVLIMTSNELGGLIPVELGNCVGLTTLDLGKNRLNGLIPGELAALPLLQCLVLSYNNLTGVIPSRGSKYFQQVNIPDLSFVQHRGTFDLSNNLLSGPIPHELGSCVVLVDLLLNNNMLSGEIPTSLARLTNLTILDLSGNLLTGTIPKEFGDSYKLQGLFVGNNQIEGPIPESLGKLDGLVKLNLTNNFCKTNIIGDGEFGTVYKATLADGRMVAVKKLNQDKTQGNREFLAEMETLGKVKHRNLVPLLGYCSYDDEKVLVYDYMVNCSLDLWLRNRSGGLEVLDWNSRLRIAVGAASGLSFLHHGFTPHIIHRDIKASNILLSHDFEPMVADFGLARLISAYETHVSTDVAGTFGYIPPEYGQSWKATTRGDVYSFGVILLELVTGREPTRPNSKTLKVETWLVGFLRRSKAGRLWMFLTQQFLMQIQSSQCFKPCKSLLYALLIILLVALLCFM